MTEEIYIIVTPFFPSPARWQGAYCFDFVRALEHHTKVLVFVPGDGSDYEYQGIMVHTFRERNLPSAIFPFFFRRYNERAFLKKVRSVLTTNHQSLTTISVCHAHTARYAIYPLAIKRINPACQTLMHHHDPQSFGLGMGILRYCSFYNAWLFRTFRKVFEQIDVHVFISEMVRRSFLLAPDASWTQYESYWRQMRGPKFFRCHPAHIKRSIVLHNGVDTAIFNREVKVKGQGQQRHGSSLFVIGCIANLEDWKDPITLVKACVLVQKKLSSLQLQLPTTTSLPLQLKLPATTIKLLVVGSGSDVPEMKRLAAEGGLKLEIRSEVDHTLLPSFYRELDLFALPSYFEGFGCVFTEAYASGVPFITCEGQGMDDLVADDERSLWLCKQGRPDDLAAKILNYMQNRSKQHLKGEIEITALVADFCAQIGGME